MKLYLLERPDDDKGGWDEWDAAVVAAEDEERAKRTHPNHLEHAEAVWAWSDETKQWTYRGGPTRDHSWVGADSVVVTYLGEASADIEAGVVLESFNAG